MMMLIVQSSVATSPEMLPLDRSAEAMWLKFLIIWRFARLWALCDGIEVVENMQRCVCHLAERLPKQFCKNQVIIWYPYQKT